MNLRRNTEAINHFVDRYKQHSDEPLLKGFLKKDMNRKYTHTQKIQKWPLNIRKNTQLHL